jgi:hypothetical protein
MKAIQDLICLVQIKNIGEIQRLWRLSMMASVSVTLRSPCKPKGSYLEVNAKFTLLPYLIFKQL